MIPQLEVDMKQRNDICRKYEELTNGAKRQDDAASVSYRSGMRCKSASGLEGRRYVYDEAPNEGNRRRFDTRVQERREDQIVRTRRSSQSDVRSHYRDALKEEAINNAKQIRHDPEEQSHVPR